MSKTKETNQRKPLSRKEKQKVITKEDLKIKNKKYYSSNDVEKDTVRAKVNDVSWYASSAQLLKDACSLSFNNPLGTPLHLEDYGRVGQLSDQTLSIPTYASSISAKAVPGICCLTYVPTIGWSEDNLSPVNIAATNAYSFVVHANSRNYKYSKAHLMMYFLSMDSIYTYFAWLARVYGIVRTYSQRNYYLPQGLMIAMNVDFEDILKNLANLRTYINTFVLRASKYAVPANMSLFLRHMWMCSAVWKDTQSDKSQMYLFNPRAIYKYNATYSSSTSALQLTELGNPANLMKFNDITSIGDSLLNALDEQEDIGIMSGDVLKAYGADNLFKINMIDENFTVVPQYSAEVLSQIQNATLVGDVNPLNFDGFIITEDTSEAGLGAIISMPQLKGSVADPHVSAMLPIILNSYSESPTPEEVMVATRLKCSGYTAIDITSSTPTYATALDTCGTEIVLTADIYTYTQGSGFGMLSQISSANLASNIVFNNYALSVFECHPFIMQVSGSGESTSPFIINYLFGDLDNYTMFDYRTLEKMHLCALLSEFAVPNISLGYKG